MQFGIYHIQSEHLKPYIQYILFNYSDDKNCGLQIKSFANTNYCLGITKDAEIYWKDDSTATLRNKPGIHAYLTGIYSKPFHFQANGKQDEICIDFTPEGFLRFFPFSAKTFLFNEDVLGEAFGKNSKYFFEQIFSEKSFNKRGELIEAFLEQKLLVKQENKLLNCLSVIEKNNGEVSLADLSKMLYCSEKPLIVYSTNIWILARSIFCGYRDLGKC